MPTPRLRSSVLLSTAIAFAIVVPVATAHLSAKADPVAGKKLFTADCGKCHTFAAAGTKGKGANQGPALDGMKLTAAKVLQQVLMGGGMMPSFAGTISTAQAADIAAFVSAAKN